MRTRFNVGQRNYIILGLCSILLLMVAGYAAFRTQLTINGTSNISSEWKVLITGIQSSVLNGNASDSESPTYTATTATFKTNLINPGDSMRYTVTVENQGSIDAVLKTIQKTDSNNKAIIFNVEGTQEGEVLKAGDETSFIVEVSYNASTSSQPENLTSDLELTLNYEQATGEETAVEKVTNIGGVRIPVVESGDGLYVDDTRAGRYVYRGSNPNNYIEFNDELWRIVAKEADGTYKIVRNDVLSEKIPFDESGNRDSKSEGAGGTYCATNLGGCTAWAINDNYVNKFSDSNIIQGTVLKDASLNTYLNGEYYNNLNPMAQGLVVNHVWNVGPVPSKNNITITPNLSILDEEKITWKGKVALLSISDSILANSNQEQCQSVADINSNLSVCKTTNYLVPVSDSYWLISPRTTYSNYLMKFNSKGSIDFGAYASSPLNVRPAVYINSGISLSGDGTQSNPYTIS